MSSRTHRLHIVLFIGFLLLGGGLCVLHAPRTFSEMENRVLTSYPGIGFDEILSGQVQKDFEKACGDQMTGRDFFVQLSTGIRYLLGERQMGDVYIGGDGRYLEMVTDADISEKRLSTNILVTERVASEHPDIKTSVFLAPTNSVVAEKMLPSGAYIYDDRAVIKKISDGVPDAMILYEPRDFLPDEYFSTDHHWNTLGAERGAGMYLTAVNRQKAETDLEMKTAQAPFFGTLYSKAPLAMCHGEAFSYPVPKVMPTVLVDGKEGALYEEEYLAKKDKYAAYFGGNFGRVDIVNEDAKNEDTLLVVKDSFANSAVPYLYGSYKRIIMVDLRYFNASFLQLLEEEGPAELLFFYELSDYFEDENFSKLLK